MKRCKDIILIILTGLLILLFLVDIGAAIHSTYFMFTHIHLTRMEAIFDPGNYIAWKLFGVGLTWLVWKILQAVADTY